MFKSNRILKKRLAASAGFTIVELLIVVVVIAILAAITIVSFNGIQERAKTSAAQSAASQAAKKAAVYAATNAETYPQDEIAFLAATGLTESGDTTYEYTSASPYTSYCLTSTTRNVSYFTSNASQTPTLGGCPGHGVNGQPVVTNYITNPRAISGGSAWTNQTPAGGTASYNSTGAQDGGSAYQVLVNTSGQFRMGMPQSVGAVSPGDVIYVSMEVYAPAPTAVQMEVGAGGVYPKSAIINLVTGWNQIQTTVNISTGGTVSLVQLVTTGSVASGQTWRGSKGFVSKGATSYPYADGTSANWVWNGNANASTSKGPSL